MRPDAMVSMSWSACVSVCRTGPSTVARVHAKVMSVADLVGPTPLAVARGLRAGVGVV